MAKSPKSGKRVTVTPRMLRAGALALATLSADTSEYELVGLVYRAMASVAPQTTSEDQTPPANFLEVMRIMRSGRRDDV
jgi:hypothetical protein